MNASRSERQLSFLQALVAEHATVAGDVVEVGTNTWAIHGSIPVDGEVLLAEYLDRCADDRPRRDTLVTTARLERLRADSAGHVMVFVDVPSQRCSDELELLDRVGARLTTALAGDVGGRITVRITKQGDDVVLDLRTARPGSWTRALQRVAFDNLLAQLSSSMTKRGGTLVIGVGSFGRLHAMARVKACSAPD